MENEKKERAAKRSKEEINALVAKWKASGQTKMQFAKENNLNYYTLCIWTTVGKKKRGRPGSENFIPLRIHKPSSDHFAEINFKNGTSLVLFENVSAEFLRNILR